MIIVESKRKAVWNTKGSVLLCTSNFVRINRSEIVNLDVIDGFEGNCYYIGKNPLYATGVYRQRMEGVFIKAKQQ